MFKSIITVSLMAFSTVSFAKDCGYEIFSGLTSDHKRTVQICMHSENKDNFITVRLDEVGKPKKPEMYVHIQDVFYGHTEGTKGPGDIIIVTDGSSSFSAAKGFSGGHTVAFVKVSDDTEEIQIDLDPNTVNVKTYLGNGKHTLWDYGMGLFSDKNIHRNNIKALAPAL